jgi:hydroxymethylbilane synthase
MLRLQGAEAEIVPMSTSGDEGVQDGSSPGDLKGLWIDTIVEALQDGKIDLAVHSAKDLPAADLEGLVIGAVPERADPRDVMVMREETEPGCGVVAGTSSLRRKAQLLSAFPGISVTELRGNVDTRLKKVEEGEVDAAVLAAAGLARLGAEPAFTRPLGLDEMLPAPGQGCLALQCRQDDRALLAVLMLLDHRPSALALGAERALTRALGADCALPLGALAAAQADSIRLAACVAAPDGSRIVRAAAEAADPGRAAELAATQLLNEGAGEILEEVRSA